MPRKDIQFELITTDPSGARRGRFQTEHGTVETPTFMPVGTQGAVKAMTPDQVLDTGAEVVLANTYHLAYDGRRELVARHGGLHKFMNWPRTILTDSGGFQVFSLPDKKITDEGVTFQEEKSKKTIFLDPETSMAIQKDLGADIVMAFDECVEYPATKKYVERSLERTTRWAERCRAVDLAPHQFLFGIVQGGTHKDLRERSAKQIRDIDFDGFAVGGVSVGEGHDLMKEVTAWTTPLLPADLPRYLMGVGTPEDMVEAVERGIDMFDCVIPTRYARGGTLFTRTGRIRIGDKKFRKDKFPVDTKCSCYACANYSRAILRHLHYAGEPLYNTLASIHNIHYYEDLMREMREAIEAGRFASFKASTLAALQRPKGPDKESRPRDQDVAMSYRLLDSGDGRKLEEVVGVRIDRQAPAAVWKPRLPESEWKKATGVHVRSDRGGGHWNWKTREPGRWQAEFAGLTLELKPTPFGHLGLFAEQGDQWAFIRKAVEATAAREDRAPKVLNLFGYTGGSSLAAAQAGAQVTHVDAAKGVVDWGRRNAQLSGLADRPIRWIVEDARKFCARALRREDFYDAVILDPPSFGRGKTGEVWKIEDDLGALLDTCSALCRRKPSFMLLSAHSPGYSAISLENLILDHFEIEASQLQSGEMTIEDESGRRLPSGTFARMVQG